MPDQHFRLKLKLIFSIYLTFYTNNDQNYNTRSWDDGLEGYGQSA